MRILYVGAFRVGSMTEARRRALYDLGHEVMEVDRAPYLGHGSYLVRKIQMHLLFGPGITTYNKELVRRSNESKPDMIYVDIAVHLWPNTVAALRNCNACLVHYTSEYFGFRPYLYRHFFKTVHLYDAHVITNPLVKPMLAEKGARKIIMSEFGYDPELHHPVELTPEEETSYGADAVFVGHWEPMTEQMIIRLREAGVRVKVWGPGWRRAGNLSDRHEIRPLYGEEYVKALAAAKIGLGLLSKWNHNTSASRTFEIPAIGTFLLAERSQAHLSYYVEGKEAEFFESPEELVEKAKYYLAHDEQRKTVAAAGHRRCMQSGYSQKDRMCQILQALQ